MKAAENLENQPIWVQDLVAWLDKIEQQGEEWSERVKEVLAELPGQGLPEEFWPAGENGEEETETEAERQLLSDENRIRIQQALQNAQAIEDEWYRSGELVAVATQIPASEPQLLEKALHAAEKIQDERYRSYALVWVAAQLPASEPQLLQKALHAAEKIEDDSDRSMALAAVAAQIPPSERHVVLQKALHAAENIKHEERRLYALVWVAAQLPASERHVVLQKALQTAEKIEHDSDRSRALAEVAAQIPPSERHVVLQKALHAAEKVEHEEYQDRSAALAAVAAQIPDSDLQLLEKALHAAEKIEHEEYRSMALKAVSAQIPASKPQLLEKALQTAEKIEHEWSRLRVLEAVAAQIPDSDLQLLEKALHAAEKIEHEEYRSMALKAVSAQIPASKPQLLQQAIQLSLKFKDKQYRIETLRTIAFKFLESLLLHCPADKFSTLLEIVPQGENSSDKAKFLSALASQLSSGLFPRALQLIQTEISHPVYQAESLCNLAPYLPREQFSEALNLVQYHIPGFSYPTTALCGLIPHLSLTELEQALTIAEQRCTHPDLLRKILHQAARRLSHLPERQTEAVRSDLRDDLIDWILDRAQQQLATDSAMTAILTALIPGLTSDAHLKLIKNTILPKLASEFYRAEVLAALARSPHLTPEQLAQFRPLAERLQQDRPKATALSAFIPIAPELHQTVVDLWNNAPNSIRDDDLAFILTTRPHPRPQDQQALNQLKSDQSRALRLIRGLSGEVDRADYLIQLAPHLLQEQTLEVEAQSIAQELQDPYHRTRSLLALAAPFPDVRPEAERQIEQLKTEQFKDEESDDEESKYNYLIQHIELLSQFATIVPEQIPVLLKAIEKWAKENPFDDEGDQRTYKRRRILIALRPHLPIRLVREIDRQTGIGQAPQDLWQRALFVLRTEYRQALKTGSLRNDAKQAEDLLNLKAEIDALTDMLMMRDLEPPVAVGILGGWGSGKSYIMHLMQTRTIEIRSQALEPIEAWGLKPTEGEAAPQSQSPEQSQPAVEGETAEQSQPAAEDKTAENSKHLEQDQPAAKDKTAETSQMPDDDRVSRYVGHIYQIKFDAWTYAKANLWASLMQTIFVELDRQITLETHLREVLGTVEENQRKTIENEIWPVLYQSKDNEREWFLKNVLKDRDLIDTLKDKQSQADRSGILWKKFQESRDMANRELKATETALQLKRQQREDRKRALQTNIRRDFAPILDLTQTPSFQTIEALLGTSFSLLKRRIGRTASESLSEEILQQLFGQRSPDRNGKTGSNDSRRLWQKLEDTLNQHLGKRSADNQGKTAANDSRGLWQKLEDTLNQLDEARKKLEAAEQNTAEAAQETAAAGDSPENTSGQPSEKELEAAEQDTAEAVQKTAAVVDSPKNTPEQPSDKKEAVQKSVQNVAQIKFDLFNVAARTIEAKQALLDRHRNWNWIQKNWLLVALFLLLFVLPLGGLAWLGFNLFFSAKVTITQLAAKLATLIAPLLPGVAILQTLFRSGQKWFEETRLALHEVGKSVEHRNQELATTYERTVQERLQTDGRLQTLDQEIQALEREYDRQKQVVPINQYATLSGFIRDRLEQGTYNNQLGLMQQVKQDLADLSDKLLPPRQNDRSFHSHLADLPKMFPRGPARVVVYIDDLDRCPPDTVVEVLEAVQLLVKNPLFIAVLAIDERYINRALAKHYQGVLSLQGRPSAADYLEKIIQIPYRVRPIDEEALRNYLKAQTVVQDSETSGTKFNEFSPREFDLLVDCCQEAELSPRSLKRLTNVYKLYKVLSRTRGQRPTPREQKAILTLLAFSSRYPDLMRDILQTIGSHYEEGQHLAKEELTLAGVFHHYLANDARRQSHPYLAQDVEKLKHDVRKLVAKDLKLSEIKSIFDFVRTFSFVGDIGVDIAPSTHGSQVAPKSFA